MTGCSFLEEDIGCVHCKAAGVCVEYIDGVDIDVCASSRYNNCYIFNASQQDNMQKVIIRLRTSD